MSAIAKIRKQLQSAARREPECVQPFIAKLNKQLRNYAKGTDDDKAALRPQIEANMQRLQQARPAADGR